MPSLAMALVLAAVAFGVVGCEKKSDAETAVVRMPATSVAAAAPAAAQPQTAAEAMGAKPAAGGDGGAVAAGDTPPAKNYELGITPPAAVKVGAQAQASVVLKPLNGYKVNKDYPIELKIGPSTGVKLTKATLSRTDATIDEKQAAFMVGFTAESAGPKSLTGELKFSVCTPKFCDIKREPVAIAIAVDAQ